MISKIKAMINKINFYYLSLFVSAILLPLTSFADASNPSANVMEIFRGQLLLSMSNIILTNGPLNSSISGLVFGLTGFCFIIGIFQTVYNHYGSPSFLVSWVKVAVCTFIVMAITGQSSAYTRFIPAPHNRPVSAGPRTLDTDVYFTVAGIFDEVANGITSAYGPQMYSTEYTKLMQTITGFSLAAANCKMPTNSAACLQTQFAAIKNKQDPSAAGAINPNNKDVNVNKDGTPETEKSLSFYETVTQAADKFLIIFNLFNAMLPLYLIQAFIVILDYVRIFVNYLTLIVFSLITAMSLFFIKLIVPFLILENHRGKVIQAFKVPLATTMFGFVSALMIALGALIIQGVNSAISASLFQKAQTGNVSSVDLFQLIIGVAMSVSAVLALQIMAMKNIPGLCKKLWDLSLTEIVEMGKTIVEAGLGALKAAASVAATVGTAGAAGIIAGAGAALGASGGGASAGKAAIAGLKAGAGKFGSKALGLSGGGGSGGPSGGLQGLIGGGGTGGGGTGGGGTGGGGTGGGGTGGGGTGGGTGGNNASSATPPPTSLGFKSQAGNLANPVEDLTDPKNQAKSLRHEDELLQKNTGKLANFKEAASVVGNFAKTGINTAVKLAGAGVSAAFGGNPDIGGIFKEGAQSFTQNSAQAVDSYKKIKSNNEVRDAAIGRRQDEIAINMGQGKEAIDPKQFADLEKKISKGKMGEADYDNISSLMTNGDQSKLAAPDLARYNSLINDQGYQAHVNAKFDDLSNKVVQGTATKDEYLSLNKMNNGGEMEQLNKRNIIDVNRSTAQQQAVANSAQGKQLELERQAEAKRILSESINKDGSVNYLNSGNTIEAIRTGLVTRADKSTNNQAIQLDQENKKSMSKSWNENEAKAQESLNEAVRSGDLARTNALKLDLSRIQEEKKRRGV
jgi:hypothetical protein